VVRRKLPFLLLANFFRNFIYETKIIMSEHEVHQSLFIDVETDDPEEPFCVKYRFLSGIV